MEHYWIGLFVRDAGQRASAEVGADTSRRGITNWTLLERNLHKTIAASYVRLPTPASTHTDSSYM